MGKIGATGIFLPICHSILFTFAKKLIHNDKTITDISPSCIITANYRL